MYHPTKKPPNKILWGIVAGIVALHAVVLVIFGGITLYEAMRPLDSAFEDPPPAEKIERVRLEYKVRMQEKQKQSARPKQKLQVQSVNNVNMPDLDIQVPNLGSSGNVGRFGDGRFGDMGDGLGIGEVSVELFDLRAKGEKFLFVIDVRRDLMQDAKGGLPSYQVIKEDVTRLISDLPSGVLFNALLFEGYRIESWRPNLVPATATNKASFEQWIRPVNSSANQIGLRRVNYRPEAWRMPLVRDMLRANSGRNHALLVAAAALEQQPDGIFFFTDSLPSMEQGLRRTEEAIRKARESYQKRREEYLKEIKKAGFDSEVDYRRKRSATQQKVNRMVAEFKQNEQAQRAKAGKPPRIYSGAEEGQLRGEMEKRASRDDDYVENVPMPNPEAGNEPVPEREMEAFFERLMRLHYDQSGADRPVLNAVIFKGADEDWSKDDDRRAKDFVGEFNGDHRVLKGLGAIESGEFQN